MARCLFTNEDLSEKTREEHTIQRSLGGRIRSREVSSNAFNEKCGGLIDSILGELYWDTMSVLGPALPEASRRGDHLVQIPDQPGHYFVDKFGAVGLRGAAVISRDPTTRRPTAVLACDEAAMQHVTQNVLPGANVQRATTLPPSLNVSLPGRPVICLEIEFAVLKAALLTFDHLLCGQIDRFTRSPALQKVRSLVRRCVMDGDEPDAQQIGQLVLGLQYDADYADIYQRLRGEVDFPASPFEHVLLASANAPTRTLDIVFWAFRSDPYAFRVCDDWQNDSFTYVAVNGVLAETTFSNAIRIDGGRLLGRRTRWRSYRYITPSTLPDEGERIRDELLSEDRIFFARQLTSPNGGSTKSSLLVSRTWQL